MAKPKIYFWVYNIEVLVLSIELGKQHHIIKIKMVEYKILSEVLIVYLFKCTSCVLMRYIRNERMGESTLIKIT